MGEVNKVGKSERPKVRKSGRREDEALIPIAIGMPKGGKYERPEDGKKSSYNSVLTRRTNI
jgi:hypothetical protein